MSSARVGRLVSLPLALGIVATVVGCGQSMPEAAAPSAAAQPGAARPALCAAPRPTPPTTLNRDTRRRARIVRLGDSTGGVRHFEDATVADIATLLTERFLSPDDRQNEAPDAWQFFQFLCRHPEVRAGGYAVEPERDDYRVTLDAIEAPHASPELMREARAFCAQSDEPQFDDGIGCWWD